MKLELEDLLRLEVQLINQQPETAQKMYKDQLHDLKNAQDVLNALVLID